MKKFFKVLSLVLVFMLAIAPLAISFADTPFSVDTGVGNPLSDAGVDNWFNKAASAIQFVGYGIAVVMVLWLGIQYMLAQPAKKAELKGKMWSMLIGIILIVAGSTIIGLVWSAAGDLESDVEVSDIIDTSIVEHLA